jgi:DNA-binding XRE family transcriptional regulator
MKNKIKTPRILKVKSIKDFNLYCIFNNGETRVIDFKALFKKWAIKRDDPEYILLDFNEFKKVKVRNQTLSWNNIKIPLVAMNGKESNYPYEISPDILYKFSKKIESEKHRYYFGSIIKKIRLQEGITQDELAKLSGTSKTYISRIENDSIEPALTTLYKIIEVGLGKRLRIEIGK